jgi:hypothetical protein
MSDGRRNGSIGLAYATGLITLVWGLFKAFWDWLFPVARQFRCDCVFSGEKTIDFLCCATFGIVLIWWAASKETSDAQGSDLSCMRRRREAQQRAKLCGVTAQKAFGTIPDNPDLNFLDPFIKGRNRGIGFESVTMVVTVVTALVAIFALTHDLFKTEKASPSVVVIYKHEP